MSKPQIALLISVGLCATVTAVPASSPPPQKWDVRLNVVQFPPPERPDVFVELSALKLNSILISRDGLVEATRAGELTRADATALRSALDQKVRSALRKNRHWDKPGTEVWRLRSFSLHLNSKEFQGKWGGILEFAPPEVQNYVQRILAEADRLPAVTSAFAYLRCPSGPMYASRLEGIKQRGALRVYRIGELGAVPRRLIERAISTTPASIELREEDVETLGTLISSGNALYVERGGRGYELRLNKSPGAGK